MARYTFEFKTNSTKYTAETFSDSFTCLEKLRTIYLQCLHDARVIPVSTVVNGPNCGINKRTGTYKKVWCRRDPAPNVMMISKLIREVKGHKPITFREFVFLFRKPANVCFTSSYTFLQSPLDQYLAYPKYMIHI